MYISLSQPYLFLTATSPRGTRLVHEQLSFSLFHWQLDPFGSEMVAVLFILFVFDSFLFSVKFGGTLTHRGEAVFFSRINCVIFTFTQSGLSVSDADKSQCTAKYK